jgi:plasmid stabilization system protein ParE
VNYTVILSPRALKDADRLDEWLMARSPSAAARLGDLLEETIADLSQHPLRGRSTGPTTREVNLPFGQGAYVIRYRVYGQRVIVTRIWHGLEQR